MFASRNSQLATREVSALQLANIAQRVRAARCCLLSQVASHDFATRNSQVATHAGQGRVSPCRTVQKMAGLELPVENAFSGRTIADCRSLPRPVRELFLRLHDLVGPGPFIGGQNELAHALGRSLRTVQRNLAALINAGLVIERRRQRGLTAVLLLHPVVTTYAATERIQPSRPRYARKEPRYTERATAVERASAAFAVASVRRKDGRPFVPAPYIIDLLSASERDACLAALTRHGLKARFFGLEDLDAEIAEHLYRMLKRQHHRAYTLAWIAVGVGRDPFQRNFGEEEAA